MLRGEEKNRPGNGSEEAAATLKAWWLICVRVFQIFSSFFVFAPVFLVFSLLCIFVSPSPMGSCTSFIPAADPICKKKKYIKTNRESLLVYGFSSLFPFFSSFSSTINLPNIIVTLANERNFLYSLCFSLVFGCFFFRSFLFVFLFFFCSLCSLFFFPVRSFKGLIYSLNMSLLRKDSMH